MLHTNWKNTTNTVQQDAQAGEEVVLEGNTYEIIRNRLNGFGKQLRERLEKLNQGRKEVFGSIETVLLSTERVTTSNNCGWGEYA